MTLVFRSIKGSKLTSAEVDGNFSYLESLIGGQGNAVVSESGFTLVDQDLTINADWVWAILGISYTNTAAVVLNIPFASSGNQRIDLIVANQSNTFERVAGTESASNPTAPPVPTSKILVTFITVTDGVVGTPVLPIVGSQFKKKSESAAYNDPSLSGTNAVIQLQPNGQSGYAFSNAGLTSIDGLSLDLITGISEAESPYEGKDIVIYNNKSTNLILLHDGPGTASSKFLLEGGVDLVIPAGGKVWLKYGVDYTEMIFKSWSDVEGSFTFSQRNVRLSATLTGGNWYGFVANSNFSTSTFTTNFGASILSITDANLRSMNGYVIDGDKIKMLNYVNIMQPLTETSIDFEIQIWKYDFQINVSNASATNLRKVIDYHFTGANNLLTGKFDNVVSTDAIDTPIGYRSKYIIFLKTNGGTSFIYPAIDWNFKF